MGSEITPAAKHLGQLGIPYRVYVHPGPIFSLEQAAQERGQRPEQVVRSILFRVTTDQFVMALATGNRQVKWPVLRKFLNQNRLTMATPDEVEEITGYVPGSVTPFGLPVPMRILIDKSVLSETEVSIGSGVRGTTIILTSADLLRALNSPEIGDFT